MIVYYLWVGCLHKPIECLCRCTFKPCVGLAFLAHTIHNILAFLPLLNHIYYGILVVLQVGINRNHCSTCSKAFLHTGPKGTLMAFVVGKLNAHNIVMYIGKLLYKLPCVVAAAIVYKNNLAINAGNLFQSYQHFLQLAHRPRQYFFLVITRNYDVYGLTRLHNLYNWDVM